MTVPNDIACWNTRYLFMTRIEKVNYNTDFTFFANNFLIIISNIIVTDGAN